MTFKELKNKIKEEQKSLAQEIKEYKSLRKESQYGYVAGLAHRQYQYRHTHIAYCQFFNQTPYGMIEQTCHEDPSKAIIKDYMKKWESQIDEALRDCA